MFCHTLKKRSKQRRMLFWGVSCYVWWIFKGKVRWNRRWDTSDWASRTRYKTKMLLKLFLIFVDYSHRWLFSPAGNMDLKMAMVQVEISQQLLRWLSWKFGSNIPGPQRMNTSLSVDPLTFQSGNLPHQIAVTQNHLESLSCTWFLLLMLSQDGEQVKQYNCSALACLHHRC